MDIEKGSRVTQKRPAPGLIALIAFWLLSVAPLSSHEQNSARAGTAPT